jgi:glycolate oxidase subunit GlcD
MSEPALKARLSRSIRRGRILTAPAQLAGYDADGLGYKTYRPDAVVIPADADELTALLRDSASLGVPITIRGAGTSLSGGPVAAQGGVVVHTSALKKVRSISREGFWCEVECSVVLNSLDAQLLPYGLFYPPDPSSGSVCTLGGNIAMNAGGAHCFRYGVTSNYVLGVEAVLLDGSVHRFGGPAGGRGSWREDWKRLMVGSEGTLAAFTRFWLRLLPRPEKAWTYRATFPDLKSAERAIHALSAHASFPVAIELMDPRCVAMVEKSPMAVGLPQDAFLLVVEIDGPPVLVNARATLLADLLRECGALNVEYSDDEELRKRLWKARKVAGGLMGQISPDFLVQDAVIPKRALADVLQLVYDEADAAGLPVVNVFHAGDGNLHPNFLFDSRKPGELEKVEAISKRLMHRVIELGGTLSGEHGIGNDKTAYMPLAFGESTLRLQLAVPAVFNAGHQLNPLKVFRNRRFENTAKALTAAVDNNGDRHDQEPQRQPATTSAERPLFEPILDEVDGVLCLPATATAADVYRQAVAHRLRFPLLLDESLSLRDQFASTQYAPASSRFGPLCDNILGMNWKLPTGQIVRIGERVVKSTTGYDLFRFLLNARSHFGEPVDYVVRLRPDCGGSYVFKLTGSMTELQQAASGLLSTCWMHWFDAIQLIAEGRSEPRQLQIWLNCPTAEFDVYESEIQRLAELHHLSASSTSVLRPPLAGRPDFMLKTTPDRVIDLATRIADMTETTCHALCYNGVVHGYVSRVTSESSSEVISDIVERFSDELLAVGGEWQSVQLASKAADTVESTWLNLLSQEFCRS